MLIRDSAIYTASKMLPGLLGVATTAILTRLLTPQEYGLYGLALVVMVLGSLILFQWLCLSFLRFYQMRTRDHQLVPTFISMFLVMVLLSALGFLLALAIGAIPEQFFGTAVIGLLMIWATSWFELVSRLAVAEFAPIEYLKMNFARAFLIMISASATAWATRDPLWTALATGVAIISGTFFGRLSIPRPAWRGFDRRLARDVVIFGAPQAASLAMFVLVDAGTRLLLARLNSPSALGLYTAAAGLASSTIGVIADGVCSAGYSLAVLEVERGDHAAAQRQLMANGTLLIAVLAPAALGIALTAKCIATIFVGSKFVSGVAPLMPWMAAFSFLNALRANHLDHAFQLGKRAHLQIWVMGLAGVITLVLGVFLIPKQGPTGAVIAVTVGYAVACVYSMIVGRYAYPIPVPTEASLRVGVCCAVMAAVVVGLPDSGWTGLIFRSTFGALAYTLTGFAVNLLDTRTFAMRFVRSTFAR